MKKLLTTFIIFLTAYYAHSLSILPNAFQGSALCNNLSTTFFVPDELQGKYTYELTVTKNEAENFIFLDYTLEYGGDDTLKKITNDLNEYFAGESYLYQEKILWNAVYSLSLGGTELYRDTLSALPYEACYEVEYECNQVEVTRKVLRKICPEYEYYPEFSAEVINDSILVDFSESIQPKDGSCDAIGYWVKSDSLFLDNLEPDFYSVFRVENWDIVCITSPCPNTFYFPIGTADLHNCPSNEGENVFDGSKLCGDLTLTLNLPESMRGHYAYDYNAWIDDETGRLIVPYYLNYNEEEDSISEITIDFSWFATHLNFPRDREIEVVQEIYYEGIPVYRKMSNGFAYSTCYEFSADCEGAEIYRKSLREICPEFDISTTKSYQIMDDSLVVKFEDLYEYMEWTCLAEGSYMHVDSIIIKDLDARLYRLYAGEYGTYKDLRRPEIPFKPSYQGEIDLRECVITASPKYKEINCGKPYPNPAHNTIQMHDFKGNLTLTSSTGQVFVISGDGQYDISTLESGLYIISYERNGRIEREKFIIR